MKEDSPLLGIEQELVDKVCREVMIKKPLIFINNVFKILHEEQSNLCEYLDLLGRQRVIDNVLIFKLGLAMTYSMIPLEHRSNPLTKEEIFIACRSIGEYTNPESEEDQQKTTVNLSVFLKKTEEDPALNNWLAITHSELSTQKSRSDFLLGSLSAVIPFLMRVEAQQMEKRFK